MSNPRPHLEKLDRIRARAVYQTLEEAEKRYNPLCQCGKPAVIQTTRLFCADCAPPET